MEREGTRPNLEIAMGAPDVGRFGPMRAPPSSNCFSADNVNARLKFAQIKGVVVQERDPTETGPFRKRTGLSVQVGRCRATSGSGQVDTRPVDILIETARIAAVV